MQGVKGISSAAVSPQVQAQRREKKEEVATAGTPRKLDDKTIEDLIAEYRHLCALGHIVQADMIMEEIGYFQSFEPQTGN